MANYGKNKQLLGSQEISALKQKGILKEDEYAFVEGDVVIGENVKTLATRVLGKAAELLVESGSKRVLKG
jgi:hypothetical protein